MPLYHVMVYNKNDIIFYVKNLFSLFIITSANQDFLQALSAIL